MSGGRSWARSSGDINQVRKITPSEQADTLLLDLLRSAMGIGSENSLDIMLAPMVGTDQTLLMDYDNTVKDNQLVSAGTIFYTYHIPLPLTIANGKYRLHINTVNMILRDVDVDDMITSRALVEYAEDGSESDVFLNTTDWTTLLLNSDVVNVTISAGIKSAFFEIGFTRTGAAELDFQHPWINYHYEEV